jgi:putative intracellular protease/amidase
MRRTIAVVALSLILLSCSVAPKNQGKVLMIINGPSMDLELVLEDEVNVMRNLLQKAGFEVVVAADSKQPLVAGSAKLTPDLKISDVRIADYKGFIMPCMGNPTAQFTLEDYAIVKKAVAEEKPLAAQLSSVILLLQAGVLKGKKYALPEDLAKESHLYEDAIYSGEGVVQDGRIITSGISPLYLKMMRGSVARTLAVIGITAMRDGTVKLTDAFIAELRK